MRRSRAVFFGLMKWGAWATAVGAPVFTPTFAHALSPMKCPQNTADWSEWRSLLFDSIRQQGDAKGFAFAAKRIEACDSALEDASVIKLQLESPEQRPDRLRSIARSEIQACFGTIREYARYFGKPKDNYPTVNNLDSYNANAEKANSQAIRMPEELYKGTDPDKNAEFIRLTTTGLQEAATDPAARAQVVTKIRELVTSTYPGAVVQAYDSRHFQSPDLTPGDNGRLLIYLPGEKLDRWIQFGLPAQKYPKPSPNVSFISVVKQDDQGNALKPYESYFQDYTASTDPAKPYRSKSRQTSSMNCRDCHANGPNAIWPKSGGPNSSLISEDADSKLYSAISGYGRVVMPGFPDSDSTARPAIGADARRDPDDLPGCANQPGFKRLRPESRARIADAMNCALCHNGRQRSPMRLALGGADSLEYLRTAVVTRGAMPPGAQLSPGEREILLGCLVGEASGGAGPTGTPQKGNPAAESAALQTVRASRCGQTTTAPIGETRAPGEPAVNRARTGPPRKRGQPPTAPPYPEPETPGTSSGAYVPGIGSP